MDVLTIDPNMLRGTVQVPPSKSVAHRAIIAAALSRETCRIRNIAPSKDILATLRCMKALGTAFSVDEKEHTVVFERTAQRRIKKEAVLCCEESGSTLRFLIPLALLCAKTVTFVGKGRLMQRPQTPYFSIFDKKGISYHMEGDRLRVSGTLSAGHYALSGFDAFGAKRLWDFGDP